MTSPRARSSSRAVAASSGAVAASSGATAAVTARGARRVYEGHDLEALADLPRYTHWILDAFAPYVRGRVLEVGAGIGNVAARYLDRVEHATLVEPADNLAARMRERFAGDERAVVFEGLLGELPVIEGEPRFDAALMVNVLEHIAEDLDALREVHRRLRPDGRLLLFSPALPWLYGSLDRLVHHERRYTRASLRTTVERCGFEVERLHYCDILGVLPWWLFGRVLKRRVFDPSAAGLYDRVGVPLTGMIEDLTVPPLGKSLVCVARPRTPRED